ncbi:hypothetical protein [Bacillus sp. S66]|uniref:hypothetical protein n=1 Tax=Bacillus sp. S66 TaxID=1842608 RepID=UPI000ECBB5D8|nr:hypothetical protein [Bacillus sp. S66]RKN53535.1 hypothetical protein D7H67_26115 [Bacillus sp. S66]
MKLREEIKLYVKELPEEVAKKMLTSILIKYHDIGYAGEPRVNGEKAVLKEIDEIIDDINAEGLF